MKRSSKTLLVAFLLLSAVYLGAAYGTGQAAAARPVYCANVAAGGTFSLALLSDGTVKAWGLNDNGQLGNGSFRDSAIPVPVSGLTGVVAVAAGMDFGLALKSDGTVWAWGDNHSGQLGNGSNAGSPVPVRVANLDGVVAVAAGGFHSLALKRDGTVWAWGNNDYGQLGDEEGDAWEPVQVAGVTGAIAVSAGTGHSLALKSDGTVWAWGSNFVGQLGRGFRADSFFGSAPPAPVKGLGEVSAVAAGGSHNLALKRDGTVWTWGNNGYGQLGDGSNDGIATLPVRVAGLNGVVAIAAGSEHSLAIKGDGSLWAWGGNEDGQLGDGGDRSSAVPVQVAGLSGVAAAAFDYTLALQRDGSVWAWGLSNTGGEGVAVRRPARVSGL